MLSSACRRGFLSCARKAANPLAFLFAAGQQGVFFDPSDLSTLFQDSAGTNPVTAVGQSVGKILDKSGRGNHAIQATSANRPILQQDANGSYYLAFDGTKSSLATAASVDFTGTAQMTVFAGAYKSSDAATALLAELTADLNSNNGAFYVAAPISAGTANISFSSKGTTASQVSVTSPTYASPVLFVATAIASISGPTSTLRVNGAQVSTSAATQGTGNYSSAPIYLGGRAGTSLFLNGRIYALIVRGAASSASEIAAAEAWVNGKTRAY